MHRRLWLLIAVACSASISGCADAPPPADRASAGGGVVDSALPIDVLLTRFRAGIADSPTVLRGGADSPDALTRALLQAIETHDTTALRGLVVSKAEFAWLYYPFTRYTRPPYELGPEFVWLQQGAASEKGVGRLLGRYGGTALRLSTVSCSDRVVVEGPNRIIGDCRVRLSRGDSAPGEARLFGALLNRDGRYKFLTYANDL